MTSPAADADADTDARGALALALALTRTAGTSGFNVLAAVQDVLNLPLHAHTPDPAGASGSWPLDHRPPTQTQRASGPGHAAAPVPGFTVTRNHNHEAPSSTRPPMALHPHRQVQPVHSAPYSHIQAGQAGTYPNPNRGGASTAAFPPPSANAYYVPTARGPPDTNISITGGTPHALHPYPTPPKEPTPLRTQPPTVTVTPSSYRHRHPTHPHPHPHPRPALPLPLPPAPDAALLLAPSQHLFSKAWDATAHLLTQTHASYAHLLTHERAQLQLAGGKIQAEQGLGREMGRVVRENEGLRAEVRALRAQWEAAVGEVGRVEQENARLGRRVGELEAGVREGEGRKGKGKRRREEEEEEVLGVVVRQRLVAQNRRLERELGEARERERERERERAAQESKSANAAFLESEAEDEGVDLEYPAPGDVGTGVREESKVAVGDEDEGQKLAATPGIEPVRTPGLMIKAETLEEELQFEFLG